MKTILILLFAFFFTALKAQNANTQIRIIDLNTKEPIGFSKLFLTPALINTRTDADGKANLSIPLTTQQKLIVSANGFLNDTTLINAAIKTNYTIYLKPVSQLLNEVVISGNSVPTLLRETPNAITILSAKAIDHTSESNLIDALAKHITGLNVVKTGPNISKPFIRGLGYNRVLTLYDGLRQEGQQWGDEHGIEIDAYNIEKAEVIKGPASLMFGSDALAGVVSLFPYSPKQTDGIISGRVLSEYQINNGLIGNGLRLGCNYGKFFWNVSATHRLARNYKNSIDGPVYNTGFKETTTTALLGYNFPKAKLTLNITTYNNLQGIPDGSRDSITRSFTKQIYEGDFDDIKTRPIVTEKDLRSYTLSPLHQRIQHYRVYSNGRYKIAKGTATSLFGIQQNIRQEFNHPTTPQLPGLNAKLTTISGNVQLQYPLSNNLAVTFGLNTMYQNNKSLIATDFPIPNYKLIETGSYLFGKWNLTSIVITGGLRYDVKQLKTQNLYVNTDANGFQKQVKIPDTAGAILKYQSIEKNYNGVSASLGFSSKINSKLNVKFNIARGYRSPNITEVASNGLDPGAHIYYVGNINALPETNLEEDLGIDYNYNELTFSFSIFNNNLSNYIFLNQLTDNNGNSIVDAQGNKTFEYQQSKAQLYGFETNVNYRPKNIKGFGISSSLSVTYGENKKPEYIRKGSQGQYLPLIPPLCWRTEMEQKISLIPKKALDLNVKAEYEFVAKQTRYMGLNNTETPSNSYHLFNLFVGTEFKYFGSNKLSLQLQVNNLFDISYQSHLNRLKYFEYYNNVNHSGIYNMGRNVCVKVIANF